MENRPINFNDPTGHKLEKGDAAGGYCDPNCQLYKQRTRNEKKIKDKGEAETPHQESCGYEDYYACNQGKKRTPDYVTLNVGGSIPGLGTLLSGQLSIALDRFGNFYLGPGFSVGPEAPLGFSASLSAGFIDTWSNSLTPGNSSAPPPGEQRSEEVLSGGYANGMICIVFCGGLTNSLSNLDNVGFELLGIGVPQASVGAGKSYLVGDLKSINNNGVPIW